MITIIVATSNNNVIGKDNDMLWRLSEDFKRFKRLTSGHCIIMGRKTFESLPGVLPNRLHVVITRNKEYKVPEGVVVKHSLDAAMEFCLNDANTFIIGGGEIYKQAMEFANFLELTRVDVNIEGDTYFPEINPSDWDKVYSQSVQKDEKNQHDFTFETYKRI